MTKKKALAPELLLGRLGLRPEAGGSTLTTPCGSRPRCGRCKGTASNHLDHSFHDECCRLGARLRHCKVWL